jgi:hypothetical protein
MTKLIKFVLGPGLPWAALAIALSLGVSSVRANEIERVLFSFPVDGSTGANPNSGVIGDGKGNL